MERRGFLVVLSGPSGAGKNTLLNAVLARVPALRYSVSATTRMPRPGEVHGVDYFFLSDSEFDAWIEAGEFLEWAEFCGNRYGTPRRFVEACLDRGETVIMDIDIQGARKIQQSLPGSKHLDSVFVFLLPPSLDEQRLRLLGRGTDSEETIMRRLAVSQDEVKAIVDYDYWILNDDREQAASILEAIILAERSKVARKGYATFLGRFANEIQR